MSEDLSISRTYHEISRGRAAVAGNENPIGILESEDRRAMRQRQWPASIGDSQHRRGSGWIKAARAQQGREVFGRSGRRLRRAQRAVHH